jgi:hypothetical protein
MTKIAVLVFGPGLNVARVNAAANGPQVLISFFFVCLAKF